MSQIPLPSRVDLSDASVEHAFSDDLFPAEPVSTAATTAPTPDAVPAVPTPQPSASEEPFVRGSKTVYKTREAAQKGIDDKDALIDQLRQQYTLATGIDPITKQPLNSITPQGNDSYVLNPAKYFSDLQGSKTPEQLVRIQQKFVLDTFQPIAPAITSVTRNAAVKQVSDANPDFGAFYGSAAYKTTLENNPDLKQAVEVAEGDIAFHSKLPGLLKMTYLVHQGEQLPELLKAQRPATTQSPVRTTSTPSTPAPATYTNTPNAPTLRNQAGRKAIIASFEESGGLDKVFP